MKKKIQWIFNIGALTLPFALVSCQTKPQDPAPRTEPGPGNPGPVNPAPTPTPQLTQEQKDNIDFYLKQNNAGRFDLENKNMVDQLKLLNKQKQNSQYQDGVVYRNQNKLATSPENAQKFDTLAKTLNHDTFDNQRYKSNTIPSYKENGEIDGLNIQVKWDFLSNKTEESYAKLNDNPGKGLGRILNNQSYKEIAMQTYSLNLYKGINSSYFGTAWIIDYELSENNQYPTKWYIATNLHVANEFTKDTTYFNLTRLDPEAPLKTNLTMRERNNNDNKPLNEYFTTFNINLEVPSLKDRVKIVYRAVDFLKADPKDYLSQEQKARFSEFKEYADFVVIEIDFSNLDSKVGLEIKNPKNNNSFENPADFLKKLTNDFANKREIKFLNESYLSNYEKIDQPLANSDWSQKDTLLALGFPKEFSANNLSWPRNLTTEKDIVNYVEERYNFDFNFRNLWTNQVSKNPKFINLNQTTGQLDMNPNTNIIGNRLTNNPAVTTFKNKPGVYDAFLAWPLVDTDTNPLKTVYNDKTTSLIQMGLGYALANYEAPGGASGSSVRNDKNELVSIFHSVGPDTLLGMSSAFRSEGYNYQGLYGKYNLPQYDLIYGGGKDQAEGNSYREALAKINPNMKTHVFKEGVNKEYSQFKFNN